MNDSTSGCRLLVVDCSRTPFAYNISERDPKPLDIRITNEGGDKSMYNFKSKKIENRTSDDSRRGCSVNRIRFSLLINILPYIAAWVGGCTAPLYMGPLCRSEILATAALRCVIEFPFFMISLSLPSCSFVETTRSVGTHRHADHAVHISRRPRVGGKKRE